MMTLGCPKNRVDSEVMLGTLSGRGFRLVDEPEKASVIVVNTCAFIGPAKQESIDNILELAEHKTNGTCETLVVTGCLAQRYSGDLLKEMPEVDHFLGTSAYQQIADLLDAGDAPRQVIPDPEYIHSASTPRINSLPKYTAYVKVSEGCDNKCSFCIIPKLRGLQRSRPIDDIVAEAAKLVADGAVELNLVAQDLTAFGHDLPGKPKLHELLRELVKLDARWIRLHYAYPRVIDNAFFDLMANEPKIAKYIDMPFQHASDKLLLSMKRGRTSDYLTATVKKFRERVPGITFRTSFIVGLPGETEEDFQRLKSFVEEMRFERMGCFEYSDEEGTPAYDFEGKVPARTITRRWKELMATQKRINREQNKLLVGQTLDVLVEGVSPESNDLLIGRHQGQAPDIDGQVYINDGFAYPGELVKLEVTEAHDYDIVGKVVARESSKKPKAGSKAPTAPAPRA